MEVDIDTMSSEQPVSAYNMTGLSEDAASNRTENFFVQDNFSIVMKYINIYFTPIFVLVGITTNMLSFCVFVGTPMRMQSSSVYLASLALFDSGFLFALFINWFSWIKIHLVHRNGWCQCIMYLTYVSSFVSVWNVVSFTVERYIAVCYPFHRKTMCTVRNAIFVTCSEASFAFVIYTFALWSIRIEIDRGFSVCKPISWMSEFITIATYVDTFVTMFLPTIAIITLNVRIGYVVHQVIQSRITQTPSNSLTSKTNSTSSSSESKRLSKQSIRSGLNKNSSATCVRINTRKSRNEKNNLKTTKMLLLVSTVFVGLNLPSHAFRFQSLLMTVLYSDYVPSIEALRLQEVFQILYYINFSCNFFLYTFGMRSFRNALKRLMCKAKYSFIRPFITMKTWFLRTTVQAESVEMGSTGLERRYKM